MTTGKKKRLSMLDGLSAAPASAPPSPAAPSPAPAKAVRSARDAIDAHHVWDLDPEVILDDRPADRLDPQDVDDLRASIEASGQTVPILVRRHPTAPDRYLLVYGRRRLEAVRTSSKVAKIRALVTALDDTAALRSQVAENTARRDLSFIERALFAKELLDLGFGTQAEVAEVLNVTKSAISMALSVVRTVSPDLARAIGPAHGIGRPRWEALARALDAQRQEGQSLIATAHAARDSAPGPDASVAAFEAVMKALTPTTKPKRRPARPLAVAGKRIGTVQKTPTGLRLEIGPDSGGFGDWLDAEAQTLIQELHDRWKSGS